jgi:hypothetical protein
MLYQCAPDPDQVLAQRRLSDGRVLAVFHDPRTEQRTIFEPAVFRYVAGEVIIEMKYMRSTLKTFLLPGDSYFLVITDDTGAPEKWRTLCTRATRKSIMRAFDHFREGDDDRRSRQTTDHPMRRAADRREEESSPAVA